MTPARLRIQLRIAIERRDRAAELMIRARLYGSEPWVPEPPTYPVWTARLVGRAA